MVVQSPKGLSVAQAFKFAFVSSNNEAKYEVVLLELGLAKELSITNSELRCDSQLVASQLWGEYEGKNDRMGKYLELAQSLIAGFTRVDVT